MNDPRLNDAYRKALAHLRELQQSRGAFAGEVVWNNMLACQYVIVCHVLGHEIPDQRRRRIRVMLERLVQSDGGWGMHVESGSWLFHTVLAYVTLRLLGWGHSDPLVAGALRWIQARGGMRGMPTWGRTWLAILGLYPWSGVQPILPELWLLPEASPMHPRRLYNHMRLIYLGLSYLYGLRFSAPLDDMTLAIREELYPDGYERFPFDNYRDDLAETDAFEVPGLGLRAAFGALRALERWAPISLRKRALAHAFEHILFEFRSTQYVCLSPVNGLLFCLALHSTQPHHPELARALNGLEYWFWEDDMNGTRVAGARSDIWDTSFVIQAVCEGPRLPESQTIVRDAAAWLRQAQMLEEIRGGARHHRSPAYGGWGFADERHPWPVSDCTAEALEALMTAERLGFSDQAGKLQHGNKLAAIEFMLLRQNDDGGFGSYESRRGSMVLKHFNPAEIYGNCMLEYSYTECTASCVRSLASTTHALGDAITPELKRKIDRAIALGTNFLFSKQQAGGGWLGFWGINLTYGTYFAVSSLLAAGIMREHPSIARACLYLVGSQRADGGWGESWLGMLEQRDIQLPREQPSLVTQTAWALLTLQRAAPHEQATIRRGLEFLLQRQEQHGGWPMEPATGCFFNTAVLDYTLYRDEFPTWVLARALGSTT